MEALAGEREHSELPEGWEWRSLGKVIQVNYGKGLREKDRKGGSFRVFGSSGEIGRHDVALTAGVTIVIGRKGSVGAVHFSDVACWPIDTTYYVDEFEPHLDARYLFYFLGSQDLAHFDRSTAVPGINRNDLYEVEIPVPPLTEQRRIVARIEAFARRAEEARKLRQEAVEWVENMMPTARWQVFEGLAQNGCERQPLSEVTAYLGRGRSTQQGVSDMRLIKTRHVYPEGLRSFDDCQLSVAEAMKCAPERILQLGDVLVCSSAAGCLGRPGFFAGHAFPCTTDTHVAIVRSDSAKLDPRYLFHYFQSPQGQVELLSREQGGKWQEEKVGFRLTELNLADLRTVPVPLPPLDEQRRIVAYLDSLQAKADAIRTAQVETQKELDALMPSVLARAFAGEL